MDDQKIQTIALAFAKKEGKQIAKALTDKSKYKPDNNPISVFMAGSPGAGKTEFSRNIISILENNKEHKIIRIDGDDLRATIPGYTGNNSYLFQSAISIIIEKIHDLALKQKQSFVFDGTFSKYEKASSNIQRSLKRKRSVFIFYVYQEPTVAWRFTKEREQAEGRNIPKQSFIDQFLGAKHTIKEIINTFEDDVNVFLVKKDYEKNRVEKVVEIRKKGPLIDDFIKDRYTKKELEDLL